MFYSRTAEQEWVCCWCCVCSVCLVDTLSCYKSTRESMKPSWFRWAKDVTFDLLNTKPLTLPLWKIKFKTKGTWLSIKCKLFSWWGFALAGFFLSPRNAVDRIQIKTWYLRKTLQQNVCPAVLELAPDNELDPPWSFPSNSHAIKQLIPAFSGTSWQLSACIGSFTLVERNGPGPSLTCYLTTFSTSFQTSCCNTDAITL